MKRKFTAAFVSIALAGLLTTSCSKESNEPVRVDPSPVINKLAKIEYGDGSYDSLFYNSDLTIAKVKVHTVIPAPYDDIFVFNYDAGKRLTRINENNGEYYDYKYYDNQLLSVAHYVSGRKYDFKIYDYQDNKLVAIEEYNSLAGSPAYDFSGQVNLSYYADGNLKQEVHYSFLPDTRKPRKDVTIDYADYDNKINSLDEVGRFLYLSQVKFAKNNARKLVTKDEVSGIAQEYNFVYSYNDFSLPVTQERTYLSNGTVHREYLKYHYY